MSLLDLLDEGAGELDQVERVPTGDAVEWRRGDRPFAAATGSAAEFRLDPPVSAAALRTPDTHPSARGTDWVRFEPAELDPPAVDRARAWFASAWRRAGKA